MRQDSALKGLVGPLGAAAAPLKSGETQSRAPEFRDTQPGGASPEPRPRRGPSSALPPSAGTAPAPAPPPSAGPCRSGGGQTPPLRPACRAARLGAAQHGVATLGPPGLSLAIVCLRGCSCCGWRACAAARDAEGLRVPSEAVAAGAGSSSGAQPPRRLLKTETLRPRRSLSSASAPPPSMR